MHNMHFGFIQPPYPGVNARHGSAEKLEYMLRMLDELTSPCDLVILPEYANCPGMDDPTDMIRFADAHTEKFLVEIASIAERRHMAVAVNVLQRLDARFANVTLLFDDKGQVAGRYLKTHLSPAEAALPEIVPGEEAVVFEWNGIRLGFLTCFDLYFPEFSERLAMLSPDLVIVPTYQRSEASDVIVRQAAARALDMESFMIRCSYSMGESSTRGGHSLVADPYGAILVDAGQATGFFKAEFDPSRKRKRPAAHGLPEMSSRGIAESYRRPDLYRISGPGVGLKNSVPLPHIIAHRGLSGACPENTLPAFASAVAIGADEIEFDLWMSRDGELVVCHDETLDRTSDGSGLIRDLDWSEIRRFDAGIWHGTAWAGVPFCRLDEVLESLGGRIIMNIHIKEPGPDGLVVLRTKELAERLGLLKEIYFAGEKDVLEWARRIAPDVARCCLEGHDNGSRMLDCALEYGCSRVQFWNPNFTSADIGRAHDNGIACNLFFGDGPDTAEEAARVCRMGIDAVLTNWSNLVIPALRGTAIPDSQEK